MLTQDFWYGIQKPKWLKIFNKKPKYGLVTLDRVSFEDKEGYVYDVNKNRLTVIVIFQNRFVPYSLDVNEVNKVEQIYNNDYDRVKLSLIYDAWEINFNYDQKKVEELKLRKQVGKMYKREYEVKLNMRKGISQSTIIKLDKPVIELPNEYIMSSYIPIVRN